MKVDYKQEKSIESSVNSSARKTESGTRKLNARQLNRYRDKLLEQRRELLGDLQGMNELDRNRASSELSHYKSHQADAASDNEERDVMLGLMESDRKLLEEIERALDRIDTGTYGLCEETGQPISKVRLDAIPWARYSMEAARAREKTIGR